MPERKINRSRKDILATTVSNSSLSQGFFLTFTGFNSIFLVLTSLYVQFAIKYIEMSPWLWTNTHSIIWDNSVYKAGKKGTFVRCFFF